MSFGNSPDTHDLYQLFAGNPGRKEPAMATAPKTPIDWGKLWKSWGGYILLALVGIIAHVSIPYTWVAWLVTAGAAWLLLSNLPKWIAIVALAAITIGSFRTGLSNLIPGNWTWEGGSVFGQKGESHEDRCEAWWRSASAEAECRAEVDKIDADAKAERQRQKVASDLLEKEKRCAQAGAIGKVWHDCPQAPMPTAPFPAVIAPTPEYKRGSIYSPTGSPSPVNLKDQDGKTVTSFSCKGKGYTVLREPSGRETMVRASDNIIAATNKEMLENTGNLCDLL